MLKFRNTLFFSAFLLVFLSVTALALTPNPVVEITTSMGNIVIELNPNAAPISVANFLQYVKQGFYNNTIFHRVIPDFMIQAGGFTTGLNQKKTLPPIKNEANNKLKNLRGTIAMARTYIVDSATSQFFINLKDNEFLDYKGPSTHDFGYAVFGKVIDGMDIVDAISQVKTHTLSYYENVPEQEVTILSVKMLTKSDSIPTPSATTPK